MAGSPTILTPIPWFTECFTHQWMLFHARRGLLPTFNEASMASSVCSFFNDYRSFEGWWATMKQAYLPEFVEWVEEQRSKAS